MILMPEAPALILPLLAMLPEKTVTLNRPMPISPETVPALAMPPANVEVLSA